jgi:hypothetical protein
MRLYIIALKICNIIYNILRQLNQVMQHERDLYNSLEMNTCSLLQMAVRSSLQKRSRDTCLDTTAIKVRIAR